jgi:xylitol oxidase
MAEKLRNWAGNYEYQAERVHRPTSVEQVQELVKGARKVRALGSRHSFNDIADSPGDLISLENLNEIGVIDRERRTVTVGAGVSYGHLCRHLHENGFALPNLASLPHISVAGACATATHGSGDENGVLATSVSAIEVVTADGEIHAFSRERDGDTFKGAVVGLGGLGVVTRLTLDLLPTFSLRQEVFEQLPFAQLETAFEEVVSSAYSVSLFTDWSGDSIKQVWIKRQVTDEYATDLAPSFFGAVLAKGPRHPIGTMSPENCTEQMGVGGPWFERLPHFRMEFTPSSGEELQAEYLVPRRHAWAALRQVAAMQDRIAPLLQISEIRTIAADDLWMSPCYHQPCIGIHFTWKQDWEAVRALLPQIDERLAPFDARPHWGKLFTMAPERVQPLYVRLLDFRRLLQSYDPEGKFRNAFLDRYIF